ncbi:hypothetical protein RCL_jg5070.t1 [Rhizophagus clarus]|uniref:Ribosomal protein S10 domain-containing protein n=1 Tax=Rhizophagus clarus TaxID=94130 RepID=A0A8H3LB76_9GLOM|nr:hypothetical protein RCL_jg5070.t1 [Rhizophagus clarus]
MKTHTQAHRMASMTLRKLDKFLGSVTKTDALRERRINMSINVKHSGDQDKHQYYLYLYIYTEQHFRKFIPVIFNNSSRLGHHIKVVEVSVSEQKAHTIRQSHMPIMSAKGRCGIIFSSAHRTLINGSPYTKNYYKRLLSLLLKLSIMISHASRRKHQ